MGPTRRAGAVAGLEMELELELQWPPPRAGRGKGNAEGRAPRSGLGGLPWDIYCHTPRRYWLLVESAKSPDQKAAELAALQHGVITLAQALGLGLSREQIRYRVETGRWIRVRLRVFVLAGSPATWQQATMVACLGGPAGAVASHRSAAALYQLLDAPELPEITVPARGNGRQEGAMVHRSSVPTPDATSLAEIPVTTAARTLVDCASVLDHEALCELLDDALCQRLCTTAEITEAMGRAGRGPGRAGLASLERALLPWTPGLPPGSPAEMRLIRLLIRWGFPLPERQVKVFDRHGRFVAKVDVGWREQTVGLEYYGQRHHGPRKMQHDERRLARITAAGWEVKVVRKEDLTGHRAQALRLWLSGKLQG